MGRTHISEPISMSVVLVGAAGYGVWELVSGTAIQWQWGVLIGGCLTLTFTHWVVWSYRNMLADWAAVAEELHKAVKTLAQNYPQGEE